MAVNAEELLISVDELQERLKWVLSSDEKVLAEATIWDASNLVRQFGRPGWSAAKVPPVVKTIVRNACVRYLDLSESVTLSRAGDEAEQYTDLRERTGTVFLTDDEVETVRRAAGLDVSFTSVPMFVYSSDRAVRGCTCSGVPFGGAGDKAFPWGCDSLTGACDGCR